MTTSVMRRDWQCVIHHLHGSLALSFYSTTPAALGSFSISSYHSWGPLLYSVPGSDGGPTRRRCAMEYSNRFLDFERSTSHNKRTLAGLEQRERSAEEGHLELEHSWALSANICWKWSLPCQPEKSATKLERPCSWLNELSRFKPTRTPHYKFSMEARRRTC